MKIWVGLFSLWLGVLARGEEPLPKITPAFVSEMQRLAITIRIAEFPLTQQEYKKHLALPPFRMSFGILGPGIRSHEICVLTDPKDPLGYYGFNLYWGKKQPEAPFHPLVDEIELFFQPGDMGEYPPMSELVMQKNTAENYDPESIAQLREKMRERKLTPGEFVKEIYKR